jgi:hypothetical protein
MPGQVARTRQEQTRPARRRAICLPSTSLRAATFAREAPRSQPTICAPAPRSSSTQWTATTAAAALCSTATRLRTGLFIEEPLAAGPRDAGLRTRHLAAVQARDKREAHAAAIRVSIPHDASASSEPRRTVAARGGCRINPPRAPWIRSKAGLRKRASRLSRATAGSRRRHAQPLWHPLP